MTESNKISYDKQMFSTFEDLFFAHYVHEMENLLGAFIVTDRNCNIRFVGSEAGQILGLRRRSFEAF